MIEPISDERLAEIRAAMACAADNFRVQYFSRTIKALIARIDEAEAGWRDIGTAPKDGNTYLFRDAILGVIYGHWYDGDDDFDVACWSFQDFCGDYVEGVRPDGWMPLPKATRFAPSPEA